MKRPTLRARKFPFVENVLGGKGVGGAKPRTSLDWVGMIREDIPAVAVESVLSFVNVSQSELAQAFGIPERTLARRKREGVLNSEESSKLFRLARVMSRAREVFDGAAAAIAFAVSRGVIRQVYRIEQWSRHDKRTIEYDDGRVKTPAHKLKTIWRWSFEGAPRRKWVTILASSSTHHAHTTTRIRLSGSIVSDTFLVRSRALRAPKELLIS